MYERSFHFKIKQTVVSFVIQYKVIFYTLCEFEVAAHGRHDKPC